MPQHPVNPGRRAALSGLAASGAVLAFPALIPAACAQPAATGPALRSSAFRSFRDAVARWSRTGGTLIVDADHVESAPVTMLCVPGLSYRLSSDAPRTISYSGPHYHWLFCIYSEGRNPFVIDGALTFDGRDNCSLPFFARFENVEGAARRDFSVDGLAARNARMKSGVSRVDGSPTNGYGATAMLFSGGFDHLVLRRVQVSSVTREAGAGRAGSQGCVGIGVVANLLGTQSARHIGIEDFQVSRVDSDDRPGSAQRADMDGILVFQSAEASGTRPVIQRGTIREAAGRAIKVFAPGGGGVTRDVTVHRSVHGKTGGSNDIAHQHGDGTIEDIRFFYTGDAHSQPTVPIGLSSGTARPPAFPFAEGIVRNVTIDDRTGRPKRAIVSVYYNVEDAAPRRYRIADISDSGSAQFLLLPGALGNYGPAAIEIERVSVDLAAGLMSTEDYDRQLTVTARGLVNRNPRPAPFKVFYDGRTAPPGHGGTVFIADATVRGIAR